MFINVILPKLESRVNGLPVSEDGIMFIHFDTILACDGQTDNAVAIRQRLA